MRLTEVLQTSRSYLVIPDADVELKPANAETEAYLENRAWSNDIERLSQRSGERERGGTLQ